MAKRNNVLIDYSDQAWGEIARAGKISGVLVRRNLFTVPPWIPFLGGFVFTKTKKVISNPKELVKGMLSIILLSKMEYSQLVFQLLKRLQQTLEFIFGSRDRRT